MNQLKIKPLEIYTHKQSELGFVEKLGLSLVGFGTLAFLVSLTEVSNSNPLLFFFLTFGLVSLGAIIYFIPKIKAAPAGVKNNKLFFNSFTSRKVGAWILGIVITGFYVLLYWFPTTLANWITLVEPLSQWLRGTKADQWFLYGTFYTLAVLVMGVRVLINKRHNKYQIFRTLSVMFFQLGFAFLIPAVLIKLNQPEFYFSYFWPLKYHYLFPGSVNYLAKSGGLGYFMVFWGAGMTFIATPILSYFFGKRWYCSWVCGCGALAETAGDPFRHLSDKSLKAWKIERWMIYSILVFIILTTILVWLNSYYKGELLGSLSMSFSKTYGFLIGAMFSGVIGVGFYPIMGSRVWCRFGCPMAAILGLFQRAKSKFRITTNGDQCISCGNCSTYCEMGIDVRSYAQRGENIVRASCVGCGVCSEVCPRGVLKLENDSAEIRFNS
ncbi:MAG: 4Fe-4S dicluster domain-containing protein [Melioribacteraceae bacterium]